MEEEINNVVKEWNALIKSINQNDKEVDINKIISYDFPFKNVLKSHYEHLSINNDKAKVTNLLIPIIADVIKKANRNKKIIKELMEKYQSKKDLIKKALLNGYTMSINAEIDKKLKELGVIIINEAYNDNESEKDHENDENNDEHQKFNYVYYDGYFFILRKNNEFKELIKKREELLNKLQVMNAKKQIKEFNDEELKEFEKTQIEYMETLKKIEALPKIKI